MKKEFMVLWAKKAFDLTIDFEGTLSGGIVPPKRLISCTVRGNNTVEMQYDLPGTCGLSDVRYHVTDPTRIRTEVFVFTDDGKVFLDGTEFPGPYENDPWIAPWTGDEAMAFRRKFAAAFNAEIAS